MAYKTILLKGNGADLLRKEAIVGTILTPGMLVDVDASGLKPHAVDGGNALPLFGVENDLEGTAISHAYSTGERGFYRHCMPGEEVYAWLEQGESVVPGDFLISVGNGRLKKDTGESSTAGEMPIVARSEETLDLSTSGLTHTRLIVSVA